MYGLVLFLFGLLSEDSPCRIRPFRSLPWAAHIQFVLNGMLFILMAALLLSLPHSARARSALVMVTATCLMWLMVLSEAAKQIGTTGDVLWQELIMKLAHIVADIELIVAWILLIAGFVKKPAVQN